MTYLPTPPQDNTPNGNKRRPPTDMEIYANAYDAAYEEAIDAQFSLEAADKYASTHALEIWRMISFDRPGKVDEPAPIIPKPAPPAWKRTAMKTIASLAEATKSPAPVLPVQPHEVKKNEQRDPDELSEDEWWKTYGHHYGS